MIRMAAKPVAEKVRIRVKQEVSEFTAKAGRSPKLVVVLVGEDPASVIYTSKKGKSAEELGLLHETLKFPDSASSDDVHQAVQGLNRDPSVDGILIQRPLPKQFHEPDVLTWVSPEKDVDAFHPENVGRLQLGLPCLKPCTPFGVMEILNHYEIPIAGKNCLVIGRSSIVGKPMAALLLQAHGTIFHTHSKTQDIKSISKLCDLVIVAAGKPHLVDASFIKEGAAVVDVGIHRNAEGKIIGDVDYDSVAQVASAITPVPGGVGPMTIAMLLSNTILAARTREP